MKYVAFYDVDTFQHENRYKNGAAIAVIRYMAKVFAKAEPLEIISPARTLLKKGRFPRRVTPIGENATLIMPSTFGAGNSIARKLSLLHNNLWLLLYLFRHAQKGEKVVFYHSLSMMSVIGILTKLKKIRPVIEFREIYSDINPVRASIAKKEWTYHRCAFGFIFPSLAIKERLNIGDKPFVLAPGSYEIHISDNQKFEDGKIHLVYSGNLRKDKGGAFLTVECARHLDGRYVLHVLGTGSDECIAALRAEIAALPQGEDHAQVRYEGLMLGEPFYRFLSKCDIGLAIQKPGKYNETSFPSKILTYMGCGLKVIATAIDAVRLSPVGQYVAYCDCTDLSNIKKALDDVQNISIDPAETLKKLDAQLMQDMHKLLS